MSDTAHHQLLDQLYRAFQQHDHRTMAACYHPQATFRDAVFDLKNGLEIAAMWHMLNASAKEFRLAYRDVQADGETGKVHWDAYYLFSRTGRQVHNSIDGTFRFADGKIIQHVDTFSFWRWSRQAFGLSGWLLGWTPFLRNKVRATAMAGLRQFIATHPEYQTA